MKTTTVKIPVIICNLYLLIMRCTMACPHLFSNSRYSDVDNDVTNIVYRSKRNVGLAYIYLSNWCVRLLNNAIAAYLNYKTGINFSGTINSKVAPLFIYDGKNAGIKWHRDRDMLNKDEVPEYIAVLLLNSAKQFKGGEFSYIAGAEVSDDGKEVKIPANRLVSIKFKTLIRGEIFILRNSETVHAVYPCEGYRVTTGFRSTNIKR